MLKGEKRKRALTLCRFCTIIVLRFNTRESQTCFNHESENFTTHLNECLHSPNLH